MKTKVRIKKMAKGGLALNSFINPVPRGQANVEAERGETVLGDFNQDGEMEHLNIGGERHYNGGTPLNVPQGAFIFSDTAKMKIGGEILEQFGKPKDTKKEYTPAKLAKQYNLNFYQEKLNDKDADFYSNNTAEVMLHKNKGKLSNLAFVQEAMKGFPTGIPGVTEQLMQEDQEGQDEAPVMRYGGIPQAKNGMEKFFTDPYTKSKTKAGQTSSTKKNVLWNRGPEYLQSYEAIMPGISKMDNKTAQSKIYDYHMSTVDGQHKIAKMWDEYGITNQGKADNQLMALTNNGVFKPGSLNENSMKDLKLAYVDGMFGARQLDLDEPSNPVTRKIEDDIPLRRPERDGVPNLIPRRATVVPRKETGTIPIVPEGPKAGDPNFSNTPEEQIGPNMWDKMGLLRAATRPIDHIRPQLFRADAQVSNPTLMDNTAEIQQLQSMVATNNENIQNTSSGSAGRASMMGNMGKIFDPINASNSRTQGTNVGIVNEFGARRDLAMNNKALANLELLSKFTDQNNMFKANLTKEKQLKFNDVVTQGQNMTNNMLTLGSILEQSPNYTVGKHFWNPKFKGGVKNAFSGNKQQTSDEISPDVVRKFMKDNNTTWSEALTYLRGGSKTRTTYKGNQRYQPESTTVTE